MIILSPFSTFELPQKSLLFPFHTHTATPYFRLIFNPPLPRFLSSLFPILSYLSSLCLFFSPFVPLSFLPSGLVLPY
jgi:hypothetical protein